MYNFGYQLVLFSFYSHSGLLEVFDQLFNLEIRNFLFINYDFKEKERQRETKRGTERRKKKKRKKREK
jgi:hypothetical protein